MSTLICCHLGPSTAVRLALGEAGHHHVPFTSEALAALTAEERAALAGHAVDQRDPRDCRQSMLHLSAAPTIEGVVFSLRVQIGEKAERAAKEKAESEARIVNALTVPHADWIGKDWRRSDAPRVDVMPRGCYLTDAERIDPRVVAHREDLAECPAMQAAREEHAKMQAAKQVEEDAKKEAASAEAAQMQRRKEAALAEAAAWVAEHGSPRLRKIVAASMLDRSWGVYRDERLTAERPGWVWDNSSFEDSINPSEEALDAWAEAKVVDPDVELKYCKAETKDDESDEESAGNFVLAAEFLGRGIAKYL